MSAFDGDYPGSVALEDVEPSDEELDLIDKEGLPEDLFDEEEYEIYPNGVDAFNDDPYTKYGEE